MLSLRAITNRKHLFSGDCQIPLSSLALTGSICRSHEGQAAVKCNLKANEGQLYFLEKQLLFVSKQPTLVLFSEISAVILAR